VHIECSCKEQVHPFKPVTQQQPVAHSFHSSQNQYCIMLACCSCATVDGSTSSVEHPTCSNSKSTTNQQCDAVCMQGSSSMMMWCMLLQQNTARNLALLPDVHNRFAGRAAHRMACTTDPAVSRNAQRSSHNTSTTQPRILTCGVGPYYLLPPPCLLSSTTQPSPPSCRVSHVSVEVTVKPAVVLNRGATQEFAATLCVGHTNHLWGSLDCHQGPLQAPGSTVPSQ
jgi:hypothetical protein